MNSDSIVIKMIDTLKTNKVFRPLYKKLKSRSNKKRFSIKKINVFNPQRSDVEAVRFNLVIPTLRKTRVFAGISSALSFFLKLAGDAAECRIIIVGNELYNDKTTYAVEGYSHNKEAAKRLVFFSDGKDIDIRKNDVFVLTSWVTAISFFHIIKWQMKEFGNSLTKHVYLIQDYEPGFFPWSAEYVFAESTYRELQDNMIAVFNSKELYDFFKAKDYSFGSEIYFKPVLNASLRAKLVEAEQSGRDVSKRDKRILLYGRPSELRNAFEVIRYALEIWCNEYKDASSWEIVSLGEGFENIDLPGNKIISKGKVSLEEYAEYMITSYAGISLMVSPHPSYPPLEMSTFGIRTINNKFENKDLSSFNRNIIAIDSCAPTLIAETLTKVCEEYGAHKSFFDYDGDYLKDNNVAVAASEARQIIDEVISNG